jgi:hypothetical protein
MPGIHRLEHIQGFFAANLSNDDSIRTHPEAVPDKIPLKDPTLALDIGRTCLQPDHMLLLELKLGRVLNRNNSFISGNVRIGR